ncbi:MAG TPA: 1-deoxy-D-xylulose-5-phosphate synthase [Bacillota bacterium]|nr:1-deoxy-D-xylulose-5-phosphate synthase [Bacillota bacterium]HOL09396.1 1-deoxy-D-xylulose-5-phosphate synthase [Bacillota bacterium]HPO97120.1 1-deoxy-D-xylulose-5-phosphate synthase [Bacillota bacterium]
MTSILQSIKGPQDIKNLSIQELNNLALEIRQFLLEKVAKTGGHLAPNLGVVELTLALHSIYDSPKDKLVWDVGHQSYVHKIVTGRWKRFDSLRQYNGLSGFPKPEESEHDVFATGHSSTSISVAVGLAKARDLLGEDHKVVAIIGDGSMTGGMAFEALNHLGQLQTDLTIVLNDNEMSISRNVGALSRYLTRLKLNPRLRRLKTEVQELLRKIPRVGTATVRYLEKIEDSLGYLVIPGMLFEELGITYLGPIDGHNIADLKVIFNDARKYKGPVLIHVLTTKGKGCNYAEDNPQKFHGTGPFQLTNGQKLDTGNAHFTSYTEVFGKTIIRLAKDNPKIVAITAAMAEGTGLVPFAKEFPERFVDVGIAEEHAVTMAAGMAKRGFRPVVAIYSTFLQRAYDQIIHDVCLQQLPVLFMLDRAGIVGQDGPTHHGLFDISYLRHIPNLTIMAPKDIFELRNMIYTAITVNGPVAIRYPKQESSDILDYSDSFTEIPLGKGEVVVQGERVALVAVGSMVANALQAANCLKEAGINCTVVNARFIKPLDAELLISLVRTHSHVVTIEENVLAGGFGSAVLELLTSEGLNGIKFKMIGIPDQFITHGSTEMLLKKYGLDADGICQTVQELITPSAKKEQ